MPTPTDAIEGKASLRRKRERLAREAERDFSDLPDWMFWEKKKLENYLQNDIRTDADTHRVLGEICEFIRLTIRSLQHYEERE